MFMLCQSGRPVSITGGRHPVGNGLNPLIIKRPILIILKLFGG
jgi:hypothetical protein